MTRRRKGNGNDNLAPLPDDVAVLRAVHTLAEERLGAATAQAVARRLGVEPARRLGNGAVQGSWSGYMAPALRISPRLLALQRQGLLGFFYGHRSRREYVLTQAGRTWLAEHDLRQEGGGTDVGEPTPAVAAAAGPE